MARGRMISKSLSTSEKYAALVTQAGPIAEFCQALYPLLVIHTDDFGRLQGDPFTIKHLCHPSSPRSADEFLAALKWLHAVDLIIWYVVEGKRYIQIEQFDLHQQGLHKRTRSNFPRVPGSSGNFPEVPGNSGLREGKRIEGKGTKEKYPPTPLAGGRARKGRRPDVMRGSVCLHRPRCPSNQACIARTVADGRKARAAS
jgi:hypothetical protein